MSKASSKSKRTISEQLRAAIRESGKSCYEISKETGVSQAQLSRFMNGRDIRLSTVDVLCQALGLVLLKP